jgi:hypothetical protein
MLTGRGDFAAVYGLPIRQKVELPGRMVYNRSIPYGAESHPREKEENNR